MLGDTGRGTEGGSVTVTGNPFHTLNFTAESCQSQEVWEISETKQNSQACHVRLDKLLHEGREASVFSREEPADGFSAEATQTKRVECLPQ